MPRFQFGTTTIDYSLEYAANQKDVSITVEWLDGVKVTAPEDISNEQLQDILHKKAPWILKTWHSFNEIAEPPAPKEFVSGEKFPYLGRHYRLKAVRSFEASSPSLQLKNGRFLAIVPVGSAYINRELLYPVFKQWYIEHGSAKIKERVKLYSPKMGIHPENVSVKDQKLRWGTCTKHNVVYVNWKVMMAPMRIVDYVLVHELAHIRYRNHSKEFWELVQSVLPDFAERKEWLRVNGPRLVL